jgi:beta-lactamase regulating signal transducer with metallopeptidase domain/biopolymer transport protein ExbD
MTEIINRLGQGWLEYFTLAVAQNTLFIGLILAALHWLRSASARVKYAIAMVGLLKLLLPPFLRLPSLGAPASAPASFSNFLTFFSTTRLDADATPTLAVVPERLEVGGLLLVFWAAASLIIVIASLISTARLAHRLAGAQALSREVLPGDLRNKRVEVYLSDRIVLPLTLGLFPRRIFVPRLWNEWSCERRLMVLRHEQAHIDRRDGLAKSLQIVARALYFFHPLVLLLDRRLNEYREMACDDASLLDGQVSGLEVARHLVEIADSVVPHSLQCEPATSLIRHKNELLSRVRYQLKEGKMHSMSKLQGAAILFVMALMILPLSWYRGDAAPQAAGLAAVKAAAGEPVAKAKEEKAKQEKVKVAKHEVSIMIKDGNIAVVDGEKASLKKLPKILDEIAAQNAEGTVITLACDDGVTMGALYKVQQLLTERKLMKVKFVQGMGKDLSLILPPEDVIAKLNQIDPSDLAKIMVDAEGQASWDGKTLPDRRLQKMLAKRLSENPRLIVVLKADADTPYKDMTRVLAVVKEADARKVVIFPATEG